MTTDTQPLAPTDEDLFNLGHECELDAIEFGRAVLARWGQSYGAGEVDRADAVNLARNCLGAYNCVITKKGMRVLAEAVLSMDAALSTPQPTQAQAGAEPLSDEKVDSLCKVGPVYATEGKVTRTPTQYRDELEAAQRYVLRKGERAHGIKGGQHGTE